MMTDKMNDKNFGILDVSGNQVAAGAGFMYKGFIISMSQIFMNTPDVVVFVDEEFAPVMYQARSVEDAIIWCNAKELENITNNPMDRYHRC